MEPVIVFVEKRDGQERVLSWEILLKSREESVLLAAENDNNGVTCADLAREFLNEASEALGAPVIETVTYLRPETPVCDNCRDFPDCLYSMEMLAPERNCDICQSWQPAM